MRTGDDVLPKCIGRNLTLTQLGETPMKDRFPKEKHGRINAHIKNGAVDLSATDWMASPKLEPKAGNMFSIYLVGQTFDDLKTAFDKPSENADHDTRTFIELHDEPFGTYGQLTDQFGVSWIFKGTNSKNQIPNPKSQTQSQCSY